MAVQFDATGESFDRTTGSFPNVSSFSACCWGRIDTDRNDFSTLWGYKLAGNVIGLQTTPSGTVMSAYDAGATFITGPNMVVADWYFFALVRAGTGANQTTLYYAADGDPSLTVVTGTSADTGVSDTFTLGDSHLGGEWLHGSMAAHKTWAAVLTQTEIEAEWGSLAAVRTANLLAEYRFVDGALATDSSGNGNTLGGGTGAAWVADPDTLAAGGTIVERSVTDQVLLGDTRVSSLALARHDALLLADARTSGLDRTLADALLLGDTPAAQALRQVVAADTLLLADARGSTLERHVAEALLLADVTLRTQDLIARDGLLLADTAAADVTAGGQVVIERAVTDALLLADALVREEAHTQRDGLLLADADVRERLALLVDRLLVADTTVRAADLTLVDRVLLADVATRVRELLWTEGLALTDSVTPAYLPPGQTTLTGITIGSLDLLGRRVAPGNLMGRTIGSLDLLGRRVGAARVGHA